MRDEPVPPPSARVRMEAALLDDGEATAPTLAVRDEPARFTVLVVAPDSDVRWYVGECLRRRRELRVLEAPTVDAGVVLAERDTPNLLIVDESERRILVRMSETRAIVMVDDVQYSPPGWTGAIHILTRPFSADQLLAEVDRLLV
jgi:DNA-binding NtrC family response regulator